MPIKIYEYKNCGTCKKALKFLEERSISFKKIPIRETPPSKAELKKMLKAVGRLNKLFNTSGQDYRKLGLKDKLAGMTEAQAIDLLSQNGNLIKRPFVLDGDWATVGFKTEVWEEHF